MGMVNVSRCSGSRIIFLVSSHSSEWYTCSLSESSTQMCQRSAAPCAASRHWNAGRTSSCTRSTVLRARPARASAQPPRAASARP